MTGVARRGVPSLSSAVWSQASAPSSDATSPCPTVVADDGAEATSAIQQSSMDGFDSSRATPELVSGLQLLYLAS